MLFFSTVNSRALELLKEIQDLPDLNNFYLVGGTTLALYYGHRVSIDLDFFTEEEFDTNKLLTSLKDKFSISVLSQANNSLTIEIHSVITDFIRHNYPLINQVKMIDGIKIVSVEDIAAMKLNSMMNRGSKKDFYDIYELLQHFRLKDLISFYKSKYDFSSELVLLKSLVYFDDAEQEPDPLSLKKISWNSVRQYILETVKANAENIKF